MSPRSRRLLPAPKRREFALSHGNVSHAKALTCDVDAPTPVVSRDTTLNDMLAAVLGKRRHPSLDRPVHPAALVRV
jgi:hypothetical protein